MEILYTPEHRFKNIVDYPFAGRYHEIEQGLTIHYLDEGDPQSRETVLMIHGEPSWSYLYRSMIPVLVNAGYRCVVPDLIGFGKSAKPTSTSDYSYALHIQWTHNWLQSLELANITLFAQDWGGLIGLRLVDLNPDQFNRICISNTGLPTGDHKPSKAFLDWQAFCQKIEQFPIEKVMQGATERTLSSDELAAYRAPFPDERFTAGARIFPSLVPTRPDDPESENNRKAWKRTFMKWDKPFLTLFSDKDPITKGGDAIWQEMVPGAAGQHHQILHGGGHFIQEDKGRELSHLIDKFINDNP